MIDGFVRRLAWLFGYRGVPFSARGIFRFEALHMAVWGVAWGCLNAQFCMYVALRSLHAPEVAVFVIGASTSLANLFAIWWGSLAVRFDLKRLMVLSLAIVAAVMSSVALTAWLDLAGAAWFFTGQIVLAWIAVQASNTVRINLWRINYPDRLRARILARFAIWQMLVGSLMAVAAGAYLDGSLVVPFTDIAFDLRFLPGASSNGAYGWVFLFGAVSCLLAAAIYQRIRIRRQPLPATPRLTPATRQRMPGALVFSDAIPGWFATWVVGVSTGLREAFDVLRNDIAYRRYMRWQMLAGSANMATFVPLVFILERRFEVSYLTAAGLLAMIPQVVMVAANPFWARRFDRWDLTRFRSVQMIASASAVVCTAIGTWQQSLVVLSVGCALRGWAECGGRFAWQLGHMAFARPHNDALYMGVHQALTGIRGLTMPFLGGLIYLYVLNWHVLWLAAAMQLVASVGFSRLGTATVPTPAVEESKASLLAERTSERT